jgi:signal transduction histidine kinase
MSQQSDIATVMILSALGMLGLIGVAVLLIIVLHSRRMRHRADMAELSLRHADQVRQVEREVEQHTLREIGLELHDNVGQLLTSVRLDINAVRTVQGTETIASGMKATLDRAIGEVRRLSHSLIADRLRDRPLNAALQEECARLHRPGTLDVTYLADGEEPHLPPDHKVVLYRIFQEAVNNAMKHARADHITITLSNGGTLRLGVQDNGIGFEPGAVTGGAGMRTMRDRAALIGFQVHVVSAPGQGTHLTVSR